MHSNVVRRGGHGEAKIKRYTFKKLTLSWQRSVSYRNQLTDFPCESVDWFLYDRVLHHARVKETTTSLRKETISANENMTHLN